MAEDLAEGASAVAEAVVGKRKYPNLGYFLFDKCVAKLRFLRNCSEIFANIFKFRINKKPYFKPKIFYH